MKLDDLKKEHLVETLRLYEEHCGSGRSFIDAMYQEPETVLGHLRKHRSRDYRIGSRWDEQSKIYFETDFEGNVVVRFNSNFHQRYRQGPKYEEAEQAGKEFVKVVMEYLSRQ